jgi:hypothetical protein
MKRLFIAIFAMLAVVGVQAQTLEHNQLQYLQSKQLEFNAYKATDNYVYAEGVELTIGEPSGKLGTYKYITTAMQIAVGGTGLTPHQVGKKTKITGMSLKGYKKSGFFVQVVANMAGIGLMYIDFENAIASGEIVGLGMTSDKALEELKKAKDKLNLEIITQEEYDKIKAELMEYIKLKKATFIG